MIFDCPKREARKADEAQFGKWVFVWFHRIGRYLVVMQWVRRQVFNLSGNNGDRVVWRRPDNTVLLDKTYCSEGW